MTAKTLYSCTMSLDGFMAGPGGDMQWLTRHLGPNPVAEAREAAGEKYVNVLGAEVARSCLEAGLLDEILVLVAPVLLGDGTRLFDWPGGHSVDLVKRHVSDAPGVTNLWYDVVR
jgi:riboflavin biosynthesis pyrimidine reductase